MNKRDEYLEAIANIGMWLVWAVAAAAIIICLYGCSSASAQETLPFENLHIKQALPDYCYAMPRPMYERWCAAQNTRAVQESQRLADLARQRNPWRETYVQDNKYVASVRQQQSESVSPTKASMKGTQDTTYQGSNVQKVYRSGEVSGGPVVVLNPYAPRPAAVLFKDDGTAYVADPDRTLLAWQARRMLNEYLGQEADREFINNPPLGGSDAQ